MPDLNAFISKCVAIDLEIHPETHIILKIGGINPGNHETLSFQGKFNRHYALSKLDEFCRSATFLLGHNISRHDIPYLREHYSYLQLSKCK